MDRPKVARKYDVYDRMTVAAIVLGVWSLIGTGSTGFFGALFVAFIITMLAEFSFEIHDNEVKIRSSGQHFSLGMERKLLWGPFKLLDLMGIRNVPLGVLAGTGFFIYMMLKGFQILDILVHLILLWYLYYMRKVNK